MTRYWHAGKVALSTGGSWQDHLDRGSAGGEDFPLGVGTVAYAPDDGMLRFRTSPSTEGGGQALTLTRADGVVFELFHARDGDQAGLVLNGPSVRVRENQAVGHSGGGKGTPSQGKSTGPHMHEHARRNGRRVPISSLIGGGGLAGGEIAPIAPAKKDDSMNLLLHHAATNNTFRVLDDRIVQYRQNGDSRARALTQGAIPVMQLNTPEFVAQLLVAGFPEVAGNLALIEDLPEWGVYTKPVGGAQGAPIDYELLGRAVARYVVFPKTLTIDPPAATGTLS